MTLKISVRSDANKLARLLKKRQRVLIPKVMVSALNKTVKQVETGTVRQIAKKTGLLQRTVKLAFTRTEANTTNLTATLKSSGRHLNLIRFKATQTKAGVKANAWGKRKLYPRTFIANAGRTVFKRDPTRRAASGRAGIRSVWGPSIPHTMASRALQDEIKKTIATRWRINVNQALRRFLGKDVKL